MGRLGWVGEVGWAKGRGAGRDSWNRWAFKEWHRNLVKQKHPKIYEGGPNEVSK